MYESNLIYQKLASNCRILDLWPKFYLEYTHFICLDCDESDVKYFKDLFENKIKGLFKTKFL